MYSVKSLLQISINVLDRQFFRANILKSQHPFEISLNYSDKKTQTKTKKPTTQKPNNKTHKNIQRFFHSAAFLSTTKYEMMGKVGRNKYFHGVSRAATLMLTKLYLIRQGNIV